MSADASGGPVDIADVENRQTGAVDADAVALMHAARNIAVSLQLGEIGLIDGVGIVDLEEPSEAGAPVFRDDQVGALGRAGLPPNCLGPPKRLRPKTA